MLDPTNELLLVVQPSIDYAQRVCSCVAHPLFLATPHRADALRSAGFRTLTVDLDDPRSALACTAEYALRTGARFRGIVCFVCEYLPQTALLAAGLGLPFADGQAVARMRDKARSSAVWQQAGLAVPASRALNQQSELESFAATCDPPWILKPLDGTGSEWVLRVDQHSDLPNAHAQIQRGLQRAKGGVTPTYLAQQCIVGREFGVDFYVEGNRFRILRLCEKFLIDVPGQAGVVGGYYFPRLAQRLRRQIQDTLRQAALAIGLKRGIGMADFIFADGVIYLLEMAPRPGGDCLPDLCRAALNYDPIRTACHVAQGFAPNAMHWPRPRRSLCALHLMSDRDGIIEQLDFSALKTHEGFYQLIEAYCEPGDVLSHDPSSYEDRIIASCLAHYTHATQLPALWKSLSGAVDIAFSTQRENILP